MNIQAILAVALAVAFGTAATARAEQEGGAEGGGDKGKERGRKEMKEPGERRGLGPEAGERLMAERMEEGALMERILGNPKVVEELGLTEEQMTKLRTAAQDLQQQMAKLRTEMEQAAMEQAKILTATTLDEEALIKAVEKTGALRTEIAKLRIKQLILLKKTLTPEQLERAKQMMQRFMDRIKERRGEGAEGGEGKKGLREGIGNGELIKQHRKRMEERRKNAVQHEQAGDEVDPQDPNH